MRLVVGVIGFLLVSLPVAAWPAPEGGLHELRGTVSVLTRQQLFIAGEYYPLVNADTPDLRRSDGSATQCWAGRERITCGTLVGVGYIEQARVQIRDGRVVRIDVIEMRQ